MGRTLSRVRSLRRDQEKRQAASAAPEQNDPRPAVFDLPFHRYFTTLSPHLMYPRWLGPAVDVFRRAEFALRGQGPPVRAVVSTPTQHGKSTLCQHGLAYIVGRNPGFFHIYASYAMTLARRNNRKTRDLVSASGVRLQLRGAGEWETVEGSGVYAVGVDGSITGRPLTGIGVIDDPHKNRAEAESKAKREAAKTWYASDFVSRMHTTTSVIVPASRFHQDDLPGWLIKEHGYEYIRLPAVLDDGDIYDDASTLLAPELYTHELLREKARDEYEWWSLYMGQPRPPGKALFGRGATCLLADVPLYGRDSGGIDVAYTVRTANDKCAAVVLREANGLRFVREVMSFRAVPEEAVQKFRELANRYPRIPLTWHGSAAEVGGAEMVRSLGLPELNPILASADKVSRAQQTGLHWRSGKIVTPTDASWSAEFLDEVENFTGINDGHDDMVDGLVSADLHLGPMPTTWGEGVGSRSVVLPSGTVRSTAGLRGSY